MQVLANKNKDIQLVYTVKDKDGRTFLNADSLNIEIKVPNTFFIQA